MIPGQFDYHAPATLDEALSLLARHPDEAKILAGGHSLVPAMKLRLAMPQVLIDIGRIKDLAYIREEGDQILIGAMATHYQIESSDLLGERCPLMAETASRIGDVQVRNRGTIGGSLAHADPAADYPAAILALGAEIIAASPNGERAIKSEDFFVDMLTTALDAGEIIREIRINRPQGRYGQAYRKAAQPASGFAVIGAAAHVALDNDGNCQRASIGITGLGSKAFLLEKTAAGLAGKNLSGADILSNDEVAQELAVLKASGELNVNGDIYASEDYRLHLATVYVRRAVQAAVKRTE
jgi:carbon-monoxide dehydrogenase medium subunit